MSRNIDWANTLLLPVPDNGEVEAKEVSINGAAGVLFSGDRDKSGLMWQNNGITYMLHGRYSGDQLLAMAQSVQ